MSRHLFSPSFGTKNILETHMLRYPGSQALDCKNLGSSESMKSSCCCVASSMEVPLLKGGGQRPPMKGMRTPRGIQPRTCSLARNRFHSDALFRTR
jgi:hypothetical protein